MRRLLVPLFIVLAFFAAACGDAADTVDADVAGLPQSDVDAAPARTDGGLAALPVAEVLAAASEAPDSFRMTVSMETVGLEGSESEIADFSVEAAFDGDNAEIRLDFSALDMGTEELDMAEMAAFADMFTDGIEMRIIGDTAYVSAEMFAFLGSVDTPWVALSGDEPESQMTMPETFDAAEFLAILDNLGPGIENLGQETINGMATTRFGGAIAAADFAQATNDEFMSELTSGDLGMLEDAEVDLDVWIGDDGLVRRLDFGVGDLSATDPSLPAGAGFTFRMELTDVNKSLNIKAPPAEDVTDVEALMEQVLNLDFGFDESDFGEFGFDE